MNERNSPHARWQRWRWQLGGASLIGALLASAWISACQVTSSESGGETHFLACETDLVCIEEDPGLTCQQGYCRPSDALIDEPDGGIGAPDGGPTAQNHFAMLLTSGDDHFCSLGRDWRVQCWDDASDHQPQAERDVGLPQVFHLDASAQRTCASDMSDHVYCWQPGDEPVQLGAFDSGNSLMVNDEAVCVFDRNQELWCMGRRADGTLEPEPVHVPRPSGERRFVRSGNGTVSVLFEDGYLWVPEGWSTPRQVPYALETTDVTVASSHECRLSSTGKVWCTSLETGHFELLGMQELDFVRLQAGGSFTCGLTSAGEVYCGGHNESGQLGDGTGIDRDTWAAVAGLPPAVSLSAGDSHVCIHEAYGAIWCWGHVPGLGPQLAPVHIAGTGDHDIEQPLTPRIPATLAGQFVEAAMERSTALCECSFTEAEHLESCIPEEGARFNLRCLHAHAEDVVTTAHLACKAQDLEDETVCWSDYCAQLDQCPDPTPHCPPGDDGIPCSRSTACGLAPELTPELRCDGKQDCQDGSDEIECGTGTR